MAGIKGMHQLPLRPCPICGEMIQGKKRRMNAHKATHTVDLDDMQFVGKR